MEESFKPWFERTITDEADPNILYRMQQEVMQYAVVAVPEMEAFVTAAGEAPAGYLPASAENALHAKLHQYLQPAIDRFVALETDDQRKDFRGDLRSYVRAYSLFAQVVDWGDRDLERLYQYGAKLLLRLPGEPAVKVDIGAADLSHFRLEHTGDHNVSLTEAGDVSVRGHAADGGRAPRARDGAAVGDHRRAERPLRPRPRTSDEILVIQQVVGLVEDPAMRQIALMNDESRFGQVADDRLDDIVAENAERNTEFMKVYFDNDEFRKEIKAAARRRAYQIITAPARDDAPGRSCGPR
jgi:type I restriction enzyme R subunit